MQQGLEGLTRRALLVHQVWHALSSYYPRFSTLQGAIVKHQCLVRCQHELSRKHQLQLTGETLSKACHLLHASLHYLKWIPARV